MVSNMKDIITFSLANDDHEQELKILQSLLKDTGIAASITKYSAGDKTSSILSISYDIDVIRVKKKRNAGRHYVGHVGRYTVCQIKKMQETMTNKEIAKLLGLSERSFYRRLKENALSDDSEEFL